MGSASADPIVFWVSSQNVQGGPPYSFPLRAKSFDEPSSAARFSFQKALRQNYFVTAVLQALFLHSHARSLLEFVMTINPAITGQEASGKPPISQASLHAMLRSMEARARQAQYPDQRARILNLAGDLCFDAGERERALGYYGRAIDIHVSQHEYSAAVAICQKIVRLTPEVVRARCTLAWMAIARGLITEAQSRISDYKMAAETAGQARLARAHLLMMAEVSEDRDLLLTIAECLIELGDAENADRVYGAAFGCSYEHRMPGNADERWRTVLNRITERRAN